MQPRASENKRLSPYRLYSLIFATILAVGIIVGGTLPIVSSAPDQSARRHTALQRQSLTLSELIERTFQSADVAVGTIAEKIRVDASDPDLKKFSDRQFHQDLKEEMDGLPQIDTLGVVNASGHRVAHSRGWPSEPVDLSSRQYFQALKQNPQRGAYISDPLQGVASEHWTIILAHAVRAPSASFTSRLQLDGS